jgi:hypothetical protein
MALMVYQPSLSDIGEASPTETGYRPSLSDIGSNEQPKENLSYSLLAALPRIGEDAIKKGVDFARQIPNYYEASKTEIPAAFSTLRQHPGACSIASFSWFSGND